MKTTIDLPDSLLAEAKANARTRRLTLKQMIEEGLYLVLQRHQQPGQPFQLRDGSQDLGQQLVTRWPDIRAVIYQGRGE